jgi:penicillin-binding protein 1A
VAKTAYRMGIASKLESNPSLALGTSEVSLIELVGAYAPFANGGEAAAPHVIERVRTQGGTVLHERAAPALGRIVEAGDVAMMNVMMRETLLSGTAQRAQLAGWPAAGKTGTSQDFRDAWFIGFTAHLLTGVWLGNDDASPTRKATGGGLPVDIWNRVMRIAHHGIPVASLPGLESPFSVFVRSLAPGAPFGASADASRPAPIDRSMDGWFLDRLLGRR